MNELEAQSHREIIQVLNKGDSKGLKAILADYRGEYAVKHLVDALLAAECKANLRFVQGMLKNLSDHTIKTALNKKQKELASSRCVCYKVTFLAL